MPTICDAPIRPMHGDNSSSSGISRRQGAHQVAQKLMTRDLPLQVIDGRRFAAEVLERELGQAVRDLASLGCEAVRTRSTRSLEIGGLASPTGVAIRRRAALERRPARMDACPAQIPTITTSAARRDAQDAVGHAAGRSSLRPLRSNNPARRNAKAPPHDGDALPGMADEAAARRRRRLPVGNSTLVIGG